MVGDSASSTPLGTALYFMVTPVKLHRIRNHHSIIYYQGDLIEVLMLYERGHDELVVVGPNLVGGERVQLFITSGTSRSARHRPPPLVPRRLDRMVPARDVELGNVEELAQISGSRRLYPRIPAANGAAASA
jgi:hypothetical protein